MDALHAEYEAADKKPGDVPIVAFTGAEAVQVKNTTNYRPIMQTVGWAPSDVFTLANPRIHVVEPPAAPAMTADVAF